MRTPGILIREGISRGLAPTVEVLSIGRKNQSREPSDLLPYLPFFRPLFVRLPKNMAEMELKVLRVPLSDIDCISKTTAKVRALTPVSRGFTNDHRWSSTRSLCMLEFWMLPTNNN